MSFLLDTDTCSAHLKQRGQVTNRFLQFTGRLYVSVITVGELMTWAQRFQAPSQRSRAVQDLLSDVVLLEITEGIAMQFGKVRAGLLDAGRPTPDMDRRDGAFPQPDPRHPQYQGLCSYSGLGSC